MPVADWAGGYAGVTEQKQGMHEMHDGCRGFHVSTPAVALLPQHHHTQLRAAALLYLTEGFGDVGFHLPVHCPPHFEAVVVSLGGDVLPHWIPGQTFNQSGVSSQTRHHL